MGTKNDIVKRGISLGSESQTRCKMIVLESIKTLKDQKSVDHICQITRRINIKYKSCTEAILFAQN